MVVPGGTVGGNGARIAGGLLAAAALLTVLATFLPIYRTASRPVEGLPTSSITFGAWTIASGIAGKETTSPAWPTGVWLVLIALVAVATAVALIATARRAGSRGRIVGAFGAGIVAAATAAQCVPAIAGMLLRSAVLEYHLGGGWTLLLLAAISAAVGGIVLSVAAPPGAAFPPVPWPPGQWGPPQAVPPPPPTRPFPLQPTNTGSFPAQPPGQPPA